MFHDIKQYSEEELKKIRGEILAWIEKNENRNGRKENIKKTTTKSSVNDFIIAPNKKISANNFKKITFSNKLKWVFYSLAIIVIFLLMDILGIYVMKMKNPMLASLNKFLPFPAMKIESTYISYYTFVHDTEKLKKISSIRFNNPMWYESLKSDENIFQRYELLNILRKKYSLSVDNDIAKKGSNALYEKYNINSGNIFDDKGIKTDDIKQFIIIPEMIQKKLVQKYQKDSLEWSEGKEIVEKFIENIKNNTFNYEEARKNFDANIVLMEYDMGFIEKGVSAYAFDDSVFNLPTGGISTLYEDENGLHIYMVTDRFIEIDMIKVKDIMFIPDFNFEKVFLDEIKNINIKNYIN